jgi:hypothetical protein
MKSEGMDNAQGRAVKWTPLSKPDIAEAIAARIKERSERTKIDADMVLQGILHVAGIMGERHRRPLSGPLRICCAAISSSPSMGG